MGIMEKFQRDGIKTYNQVAIELKCEGIAPAFYTPEHHVTVIGTYSELVLGPHLDFWDRCYFWASRLCDSRAIGGYPVYRRSLEGLFRRREHTHYSY